MLPEGIGEPAIVVIGARLASAVHVEEKQAVRRARLEHLREQKQRVEVGALKHMALLLVLRRVASIKAVRQKDVGNTDLGGVHTPALSSVHLVHNVSELAGLAGAH